MNSEFLMLFVILLAGLILCSFLGGSREGMSNSQTYYGPNGSSAIIEHESNGESTLVVTGEDGVSITFTSSGSDSFVATNGATASVKTNYNGSASVEIKDKNGNILLILTNSGSGSDSDAISSNNFVGADNYDNYNHYSGTSAPTIFYGPNGGTAKINQTPGSNNIVVTYKNGLTELFQTNINNNGQPIIYYSQNGNMARIIDVGGKKAIEISSSNGSKVVYTGDNMYTYNENQDTTMNQYDAHSNTTGADVNASTNFGQYSGQTNMMTGPAGNTVATYDSSSYYNSLPAGIPKSQIPVGDEDLYILKSQVVPPVCPKCPEPIMQCPENKFDATKCPACPPCGRCPEPAFDCKKVPNYKSFNQDYMPVPVISDFSTFGM